MGFLEQSNQRETQVTVLTAGFQATGTLVSVGLMQTFINDDTKATFSLHDVTLYGLERGNPATGAQISELYVRKDEVHALAFAEMLSRDESGLMAREEPLAAYTSHYVVQGNYHMGADALLGDFFDAVKTIYVGATNVHLFPLFAMQAQMVTQAPLVYVSRTLVKMHHKV